MDDTPMEMVESLADEAEAGYEVQDIRRGRKARSRREPHGGSPNMWRWPSADERSPSFRDEPRGWRLTPVLWAIGALVRADLAR